MRSTLATLFVWIATGGGSAFAADDEVNNGFSTGFLRDGVVYAVGDLADATIEKGTPQTSISLLSSRPGPDFDPVRNVARRKLGASFYPKSARDPEGIHLSRFRFHMSPEHMWFWKPQGTRKSSWGCSTLVPFEDIECWDLSNKKGFQQLEKKYGGSRIFYFDWRGIDAERKTLIDDEFVYQPMEWDFLPVTGERYYSAYLHKMKAGNELDIFLQGFGDPLDFHYNDGKDPSPKDLQCNVQAGFFEPFNLYGSDKDFLFLTKSGRLHSLKRPDKKGWKPTKTRVAWDDPACPIAVVLTDVATGRTFAAGPDRTDPKAPKMFWFELAAEPVKEVYTPGPEPKCPESLRSVLRLATFLREQKVLPGTK